MKKSKAKFRKGQKVVIVPTQKQFTIEVFYWIDGDGWRYLSLSENAGAYEHQLAEGKP